ncbi:MAG TPA: hypothetical protein V6C52_13275 [Coleofasciculaceae cyanobacterium]|jgi:hypothetical protein
MAGCNGVGGNLPAYQNTNKCSQSLGQPASAADLSETVPVLKQNGTDQVDLNLLRFPGGFGTGGIGGGPIVLPEQPAGVPTSPNH